MTQTPMIQTSNIKKWSKLLESDFGPAIKDMYTASVVATMLDNQNKLNNKLLQESAVLTSDMANFQTYAMGIVRRQFTEMLAINTVTTIPMTQPLGLAYALRYRYAPTAGTAWANGVEAGYNTIQPNYTGTGATSAASGFATAAGEQLSNYYGSGATWTSPSADISELGMSVEQMPVIAKTRKIRTHYTLEMQQDLASVHGQDIEQILMEGMQYEVQAELDREILQRMVRAAQANTIQTLDLSATTADGRWSQEKYANIANTIVAAANRIAISTRQGAGNFVICSPDIVAALQSLQNGIFTNVATAIDGTSQVVKVGTLLGGQISVYRDTFTDTGLGSYALVGFKGSRPGESGIIYMPYIPYIVQKALGQEDASPRIVVSTRYALVDSIWGSSNYYRLIKFSGIGATAGANGTPYLPGSWDATTVNTNYQGS